MKIQIQGRDVVVSKALRAHVESRLGLALGRFGERVARVVVRISLAADDRGGSTNRCQIDVGLRPLSLRVRDTDSDPFAAVNHATDRVSRSVARALDQEHERVDPVPPSK
jgi:ribosomal subunit interface protein